MSGMGGKTRNFIFSISQAGIIGAACLLAPASFAQTNSGAAPAATTYSAKGSLGGITYTVNRLKRNSDGTLTLNLKLQGTVGTPVDKDDIGFSNGMPYSDYKILDYAGKKRYSRIEDSSGHCLCTKLTSDEIQGISSTPVDISIRFPAVPADLKTVTLELPHLREPLEGVPITD